MRPTPILTAAQMRSAEQAMFAAGMDEYALMERAGAAAADLIWRTGGVRSTLILCGTGNNGGDGFVIARLLQARGVAVRVAALGPSATVSSQRARGGWNGPVEDVMTAIPATQLVDALFGTGLSRGLDAALAQRLDALVQASAKSYAIDLPSGVDTDSGALLSPTPRFGMTIALGALKPGHLLQPAAGYAGQVVCADIGIGAAGMMHRLDPPRLLGPAASDHKYSRGLVAVVGGAMPGASILAAHAAARSGAGMVRRLAVDGLRHGADAIVTQDAMTGDQVTQYLSDERIRAVLIGPGLGRDATARDRLDRAMACGRPMVLDADALTLLGDGGRSSIPDGAILTPHEGEFAKMFGDMVGSKIDRALAAAQDRRSIIVYKGADSVIAAPDGRVAVASVASPWLSTAGTGDVLAGIVAGRLAVTGDPFRAACEAVWLHGDAARRAGAAFVADDLLVAMGAAIAARS